MMIFNSIRIRTAICAQVFGAGFLLMSVMHFMTQSEFSSEHAKNVYLLGLGLWLMYGFAAMFVSWLAAFSLRHSEYRHQVQNLCVSGIAISSALLTLSCAS